MGGRLTAHQRQELHELVAQHRNVFTKLLGRIDFLAHDIVMEPGKRVRFHPYGVPESRQQVIREEVQHMLDFGIIEESQSAWSTLL